MPDPAGELDEADRVYVDKARSAAERLGVRGDGPDQARDALADLEQILPVDADPPAASASPGGQMVKSAVKRLARWYVAYLASQVTAVGEATVRIASHLADRIDELDGATKAQAARIQDLERRVGRLESKSGERQ
jgi:hypothetical protein